LSLEERFKIADSINKEIRQDLYSFGFNHPYYCGDSEVSDDEMRHLLLSDLNIPTRTREPYPLPTLKHMKTDEFYKSLGEDLSLLSHLTVDDFVLENYKSHPKIYFPLSN
jgi:hypothetical protein